MLNRLKGVIYKACVRSAMLYGCETWALKVEDVRRLNAAGMKMLRYIGKVRLKERQTN